VWAPPRIRRPSAAPVFALQGSLSEVRVPDPRVGVDSVLLVERPRLPTSRDRLECQRSCRERRASRDEGREGTPPKGATHFFPPTDATRRRPRTGVLAHARLAATKARRERAGARVHAGTRGPRRARSSGSGRRRRARGSRGCPAARARYPRDPRDVAGHGARTRGERTAVPRRNLPGPCRGAPGHGRRWSEGLRRVT
jgi:hypothetical protein